MKRKHHSPEQLIRKLRTADQLLNQGQSVADVCRALEISDATYHRWQQRYGGMLSESAGGHKPRRPNGLRSWNRRTIGFSRRLLRRSSVFSLSQSSTRPCSIRRLWAATAQPLQCRHSGERLDGAVHGRHRFHLKAISTIPSCGSLLAAVLEQGCQ